MYVLKLETCTCLIQPRVLYRSLYVQIQLLKGVEEYKFTQQIIWYELVNVYTCTYMYILVYTWTSFVCTVLRLSSILRTQMALKDELSTANQQSSKGTS